MSRRRGSEVETAAQAQLEAHGLRTIARNVSYRVGELDLVMCERDGGLVFVEVRYRRGTGFGAGGESIDARKRQRLIRAAQQFLAANPHWAERPCRFDVVEASGEPPRLRWLRDAFRGDD